MHFFLLLVPFIIILGAFVFVAVILGFLSGLIVYAFEQDINIFKGVWFSVSGAIIIFGIIWSMSLI